VHETRDEGMDLSLRSELEQSQVTRLVTAEDVAAAVAFLASDESATISGIAMPVDGGSSSLRARVVG
jgi:NAD(P)-dependent dehydrogenase (short-subunit alcohol dehydrogenase family)